MRRVAAAYASKSRCSERIFLSEKRNSCYRFLFVLLLPGKRHGRALQHLSRDRGARLRVAGSPRANADRLPGVSGRDTGARRVRRNPRALDSVRNFPARNALINNETAKDISFRASCAFARSPFTRYRSRTAPPAIRRLRRAPRRFRACPPWSWRRCRRLRAAGSGRFLRRG